VDHGVVIANGTPAELVDSYGGHASVLFSTDAEGLDWLEEVPGFERVERTGNRVAVYGSGPLLAYTGAALVAHGIVPLDLRTGQRSLEDAFLNLTKTKPGTV
jgi:ABC-type multidrug transport system ATPase subunit